MNGVVNITIAGAEIVLRYGMHGCLEFEKCLFSNFSQSNEKILTDLIYAGMVGEAMRNRTAMPKYEDVYDLHEQFALEADYDKQAVEVWNTYNASKWGSEFMTKLTEVTKKKAEKEKQ